MMATNVWVHTWDGRTIRESQVQQMNPAQHEQRKGWWVVATLGGKEEVPVARIGRSMRSEFVAKRLASEWPQAIAAAKPGDLIRCVDGQWSTLAAQAAERGVPVAEEQEADFSPQDFSPQDFSPQDFSPQDFFTQERRRRRS